MGVPEREEDRDEENELDAVEEASPRSVVRERLRRLRCIRSSSSASPNDPVLPPLPLRKARRRSPPLLVMTEAVALEEVEGMGVVSFTEFSLSVHNMDGGFLLRRRDGRDKPKIVSDEGVAEGPADAARVASFLPPSRHSDFWAITMSTSWQTASIASSTGLWCKATCGD